ncbi:putative periplasmic serine endoprotease DegP-like [Candidatus Nitrotoga sp. 1052]|nr:putative periplasmic serine endoprotease DegP-like [Candidatus Nitrotoga sp. 1052]
MMRTMRKPVLTIVLLVILLALDSCGKKPQQAPPPVTTSGAVGAASAVVALPNFTALVKKEGPAVVNISTTQTIRREHIPFPAFPGTKQDDPFYEFFRRFAPGEMLPHEFRSQSLGSGFIISQDGYILTNAHVVEKADEVTVRLTDKREFKAKVIGADKRSDIALLKISAKDLPVVSIGDASKLEVGEWVVAIGSPFGFTNSVSQGIVSAMGRSLPGENTTPFIQTDVPINPGNSGGPLFNLNGEVIGINSQIYSRSGGYMGLSFAIPIDLAIKVKNELLKHGTVKRGWLGVTIQDVSPEHARSFGLTKASGALITTVGKDTPAARASLEIGDIILKLNGKELTDAGDLARAVADAAPGSIARLSIWRRGVAKEVVATLGDADADLTTPKPRPMDKGMAPDKIGLTMHELNPDERQMLRTDGYVVVDAVDGIAAESGIQPGDIIIAINSQRISSIKQFRTVMADVGMRAALLVQREGNMIFIPLISK